MGKHQRNMSELGPLGILRETVALCFDNVETLVWIQLTMVLPAMIAIVASAQILDIANQGLNPSSEGGPTSSSPLRFTVLLLVYVLILLINLAISIAPIGALFYTVGCCYTGMTVTYSETMHSLPKVWPRLLVTGLWIFLVACVAIFIDTSIQLGTSIFTAKPLIEIIRVLLTLVFSCYFGTILQVASGVTTLEENYGLSAISKAEKLLREKWWTAFGLFLIYVVPMGALAYADHWSRKYLDWGEHETIKKLLVQALFVVVNSLMLQWGTLSGGVLYVACKAFHHESIVLYVSLDPHNLEPYSTSPLHSSLYHENEKDNSGYLEPRPSFGRAPLSDGDIQEHLESILARAGPYRPLTHVPPVDELEVSVDVDIPPELTSWRPDTSGSGRYSRSCRGFNDVEEREKDEVEQRQRSSRLGTNP
ncbi:hypothetical protein R1sor_010847 [Riccia sorocarpa]|uniref:Transmembrane protein n=1 Tax=Riccia sorocarpa TaxID=122646 RepID=A0ABD3I0K0_9MARC